MNSLQHAGLNLRENVSLAPLTTFGIGGCARQFIEVDSSSQLEAAVRYATNSGEDWFVLGTGANILVADRGFPGIVIHNRAVGHGIENDELHVESGCIIADLIDLSVAQGLSGLEHFAGIPSTVGGALWQNLHFLSPDRERTVYIEEVLKGAKVLLECGEVEWVGREWFAFGYDDSTLQHGRHVVLEAVFVLTPKPEREIEKVVQANLDWRGLKHPENATSCSAGSVFRKAEGVGAGRLIDQSGLKGFRIGGAEISTRHANFIVNNGAATAADVRAIIDHVQKTVFADHGVALQPEISFIGEY